MNTKTCDYLIIGAGIIGISMGLTLKKKYPRSKICIIEKEEKIAFHSSGRNSGVLHAGFYYSADSLKAKFTKLGNEYLKDYCQTKRLRINHCGKLVVVKNEDELPALDELFRRAKSNQVDLQELSAEEAKKIEPRVKTFKRAAWSPNTSTIDPLEVMSHLLEDCAAAGIEVYFKTKYLSRSGNSVKTNNGTFVAGFIINAAGLYADKIAKDFNFSKNYRILPFKGLYLYCNDSENNFKTHIYPVPNLKNPFLGVHHTLTVDGRSKIGPTAIPALWREQYGGFSRFHPGEMLRILTDEARLFFGEGFDFRSLALEEIKKYKRKYLVNEASKLAEDVRLSQYTKWGKPGIRAQLFNTKTNTLEMDFIYEGDGQSFHILNAVSPAFTCSQPLAEFFCGKIGEA